MVTPTENLLPIGLVARRVRVTVKWLQGEVDAGRIPYLRAGNRVLLDPAAVEAALLERARTHGPACGATAHAFLGILKRSHEALAKVCAESPEHAEALRASVAQVEAWLAQQATEQGCGLPGCPDCGGRQ